MRDAIAGHLSLPADRVNVKASTGNLAGWDGAGRGITARAVAVLGEIGG
jgi:2C-methyl-D-erythritol 2,4-cyclodiphosphate synthase